MADMRTTWDAAASSERLDEFVGDPATADEELESLFGRLDDDPRGGVCLEVGCGPGRMSAALAQRFDLVIAVDVSPAMLKEARKAVAAPNVEFRLVSGESLDSVEDGSVEVLVCYLVLQHLPRRAVVLTYLHEFARALATNGRAYLQIPVLGPGIRPRLWRLARGVAVPLGGMSREVAHQPSYRGYRLTEDELEAGLASAGLRVTVRDESPTSPYRYAREVFLRLEHD